MRLLQCMGNRSNPPKCLHTRTLRLGQISYINRLGPLRSNIRFASSSSSQEIATDSISLVTRLKNVFLGTAIGLSFTFGYFYITDSRAGIHRWVVTPLLRWAFDDAEEAHKAGTKSLKVLYEFGLHPRERGNPDRENDLQVEVSFWSNTSHLSRWMKLRRKGVWP